MSDAPLLTEKAVGFRGWLIAEYVVDGRTVPALAPITWSRVPWVDGVNTAECWRREGGPFGKRGHRCPDRDSECGLYAYHSLGLHAFTYMAHVRGAVVAWGKLQVHRDGFRAEHAEIAALARPRRSPISPARTRQRRQRVDQVAALYGVPVVPERKLAQVAAEHGSPVPMSLRPSGRPRMASANAALGVLSMVAALLCGASAVVCGVDAVAGRGAVLNVVLLLLNLALAVWNGCRAWRAFR